MVTHNNLKPIDKDLWAVEGGPLPFYGFPYALRTTVVRLGDGTLFVHSPLPLSAPLQAQVRELGPVRHLVAPNRLHHLFLEQWRDAFPDALIHGPAELVRKRSDLQFATTLGDTAHDGWASDVDQCLVAGSFFMNEAVFFHRASRTLLLGDLIEDHDPAAFSPWQRTVARANGMFGTTPRNYRLSFVKRALTRSRVERLFAWRPKRIVVLHGPIVEHGAEAYLRRGFAWIQPRSAAWSV